MTTLSEYWPFPNIGAPLRRIGLGLQGLRRC